MFTPHLIRVGGRQVKMIEIRREILFNCSMSIGFVFSVTQVRGKTRTSNTIRRKWSTLESFPIFKPLSIESFDNVNKTMANYPTHLQLKSR